MSAPRRSPRIAAQKLLIAKLQGIIVERDQKIAELSQLTGGEEHEENEEGEEHDEEGDYEEEPEQGQTPEEVIAAQADEIARLQSALAAQAPHSPARRTPPPSRNEQVVVSPKIAQDIAELIKLKNDMEAKRSKRHRSRSSSSNSSSSSSTSRSSSPSSHSGRKSKPGHKRQWCRDDEKAFKKGGPCHNIATSIWGKDGRTLGVYSTNLRRFIIDALNRCGTHEILKRRIIAIQEGFPNQVRDIVEATEKLKKPGKFSKDLLSSADIVAEYAAAFHVVEATQKTTEVGQFFAALSEQPRTWPKKLSDYKADAIASPASTLLGPDAHQEYTGKRLLPAKLGSQQPPALSGSIPAPILPRRQIGPQQRTPKVTDDRCNNCGVRSNPSHRGYQCKKECTRHECTQDAAAKGQPVTHFGYNCPRRAPRRI